MDIQELHRKLEHRTPSILGSGNFSKFSVLLPVIEKEGALHVLFEVRALHLRRQPGEICFPGGKVDPEDVDARHTAVRETSEELGIPGQAVTDVFPLDYMVSPFGTIIYPYVGRVAIHGMNPNPDEVGEIFTVPLSYLQNTQPEVYTVSFKMEPEPSFPFHHIAGGENYNWQTRRMEEYFYYYEDRVIWGLTARILKHFLDLLYRT